MFWGILLEDMVLPGIAAYSGNRIASLNNPKSYSLYKPESVE